MLAYAVCERQVDRRNEEEIMEGMKEGRRERGRERLDVNSCVRLYFLCQNFGHKRARVQEEFVAGGVVKQTTGIEEEAGHRFSPHMVELFGDGGGGCAGRIAWVKSGRHWASREGNMRGGGEGRERERRQREARGDEGI